MIKYSKDGVEIDHLRYLSDSAIGLLFLVVVIMLSKYDNINIPFFYDAFHSSGKLVTQITTQSLADYVLIFLIFLLHPAVGVILSVFSWLLFESFYIKFFESIWWKKMWVAKMYGLESELSIVLDVFSIKYDKMYECLFDVEVYFQGIGVDLKAVYLKRSIRVMMRNISFILFLVALVYLLNLIWIKFFIALIGSLLMLFISGAMGNLSNIDLLIRYYRYYLSNQV